ncbi:MAG: hypothetical protein K2G53_10480 [Muribaculaceae bacterium]|nr:hypothetical protein [Muribaculaceae bacterium]
MRNLLFILICALGCVCFSCQTKSQQDKDSELAFSNEIEEEDDDVNSSDDPVTLQNYGGNWWGSYKSKSIETFKLKANNETGEWTFRFISGDSNSKHMNFYANINIDDYTGTQDTVYLKIGSEQFNGIISENGTIEINTSAIGDIFNIVDNGNFDISVKTKDSKEIYKFHVSDETHGANEAWKLLQDKIDTRKRYDGE